MSINQQSSSFPTYRKDGTKIIFTKGKYSFLIPSKYRRICEDGARHRRDLRTKQSPSYEKHKWMAELHSDLALQLTHFIVWGLLRRRPPRKSVRHFL